MEKNTRLNPFSSPHYKHLITVFLFLLMAAPGSLKSQKFFTAETSHAVKLGRTKPLYDLVSVAPTDTLKLKIRKSNKPKFVPNFAGRRHLDFHLPSALPQGVDPLFENTKQRLT